MPLNIFKVMSPYKEGPLGPSSYSEEEFENMFNCKKDNKKVKLKDYVQVKWETIAQ